jgi:hypothetical protein
MLVQCEPRLVDGAADCRIVPNAKTTSHETSADNLPCVHGFSKGLDCNCVTEHVARIWKEVVVASLEYCPGICLR